MTKSKRGRKEKPYRLKNGTYVNGLRRRKNDKRWVIIETGQMFSEPDETKAIARFRNMTTHGLTPEEIDNIGPMGFTGSAAFAMVHGFYLTTAPDAEARMWRWIGEEIRKAPLRRAEMSGIEQIGYITDLKPTEPLPTPKALADLWDLHSKASKGQKDKVDFAWNDFIKTTGVKELTEITTVLVVDYRDKVYARNLAPKTQQHHFTGIRRMINFAIKRGIATDALSRIASSLKLLTPSESTISLDPKPIDVADFHKLLSKAEGDNKALLLLMLNGAFYMQEAIRLMWDDIKDGCIVTHRRKTGRIVRVAVLWPETIEALATIDRKTPYIFKSYTGANLGIKGADKRFAKIRNDAKLKHISSSQLRDGAFTAAIAANVNSQLVNVLVGHRSGLSDHYVKRQPQMVAPACEAIHKHYFT